MGEYVGVMRGGGGGETQWSEAEELPSTAGWGFFLLISFSFFPFFGEWANLMVMRGPAKMVVV